MATDTKKALESIIELRKEFEDDLIYREPQKAADRLTILIESMQPTDMNDLDTVSDQDTINDFFREAQIIAEIAKNVTTASIKEFKKKEKEKQNDK